MAQEALNFIKNATIRNIDSISDIEQAARVKLQQLRDAEKSLKFLTELQSTIKNKDSVAKSIKIIAANKMTSFLRMRGLPSLSPLCLHFTVGYSAKSLLETLHFFEGNIGFEIAAFADSFVDVKVYKNKTVYSNQVDSFKVCHIKQTEESKTRLLETFPIFSLCANFSENLEQILRILNIHDFVQMPSGYWPFYGWSLDQTRELFESAFNPYRTSGNFHSFFHNHLRMVIQKRFVKYWGYAEDYTRDDSDFEDKLGNEWADFQKMVSQIDDEQWFQMWAMNKGRIPIPGGDFHQYWLPKLDPKNVFFRRKRRGKKRKLQSV